MSRAACGSLMDTHTGDPAHQIARVRHARACAVDRWVDAGRAASARRLRLLDRHDQRTRRTRSHRPVGHDDGAARPRGLSRDDSIWPDRSGPRWSGAVGDRRNRDGCGGGLSAASSGILGRAHDCGRHCVRRAVGMAAGRLASPPIGQERTCCPALDAAARRVDRRGHRSVHPPGWVWRGVVPFGVRGWR